MIVLIFITCTAKLLGRISERDCAELLDDPTAIEQADAPTPEMKFRMAMCSARKEMESASKSSSLQVIFMVRYCIACFEIATCCNILIILVLAEHEDNLYLASLSL
jgi:hypothetical protein